MNWCPLLQGAEGDGKSFFGLLMAAMIGGRNVNLIAGNALEEAYTPWAERAMVCFIEDVRLHGSNRFDAINALKPYITNITVDIRRMRTDRYKVINTVNYIATSNMKDALPVGSEDSRFFPMFSRFQTSTAVKRFKLENPDYYDNLHKALERPGALRLYFLTRQISPEFNPKARAPESQDRAEMVELNRSDEDQGFLDIIDEEDNAALSDLLLDSALMIDEFNSRGLMVSSAKAMSRMISTHGFSYLGRPKIDGEKRRFWSMYPEAWSGDETERYQQIREHLDPKGL